MLVGGAVGFFAAQAGLRTAEQLPPAVSIPLLILLIPSFFLVIGLHEAGHAFAGVKVNFDFRFYVVGPFMWEKEMDGWKFKWNTNVNTFGGMVLCLPTDSQNLSQRFARYAAGGPLASLICAAVFIVIHTLLQGVESTNLVLQITTIWMWILFLFSLIIFFVTAIPFQANGFSSDGARVWRLSRGGDTATFEVLLLKFIATSSNGMRPALLNRQEMEAALLLAEKIKAPMGLYFHYYYFYHAFDCGELALAEEQLMLYVDKSEAIPQGLRSGVLLDAAFFYAIGRRDVKNAEHYFNQFVPAALIAKSTQLATEASIQWLRKEDEKALDLIAKAQQELPNALDRGIALFMEEKLAMMQEDIVKSKQELSA